MAPSKAQRAADDAKGDAPQTEKKMGGGTKMRRITSQTSHAAAKAAEANAAPTSAPGQAAVEAPPGLDWRSFDRSALHSYRRQHSIAAPQSFKHSYHHLYMSRPNSVGMYSPTMRRKQSTRRTTKEQLGTTIRKHFNGLGIQENDVIVELLYKVQTEKSEEAKKGRKSKPWTT